MKKHLSVILNIVSFFGVVLFNNIYIMSTFVVLFFSISTYNIFKYLIGPLFRSIRSKNKHKREKIEREYSRIVENQYDSASTSNNFVKVGIRDVDINKSIKARTTGRMRREIKKATNPLYGKKGMGYVSNPKRAIKNKIYKKTTRSVKSFFK